MSTSTSRDSSHLSIGDVLNILREEFPDVTISKIRFLESQGLIDPERTPSGYRKFYDADVSRLRWILHQQKENFLPLKVIKERLERLDDDEGAPVSSIGPDAAAPPPRRRPRRTAGLDPDVAPPLPFEAAPPDAMEMSASDDGNEVPHREHAPRVQEPMSGDEAPTEVAAFQKVAPAPEPPPSEKPGLTREELAAAAGLEDWQVAELESFGLIPQFGPDDDSAFYNEEDEAIAKAAAGFYSHGIGARHLRMYKLFAEREAALFEQVSIHYLRQRNPDARSKAQAELANLSRLGRALRAALLVRAIRDSLTE